MHYCRGSLRRRNTPRITQARPASASKQHQPADGGRQLRSVENRPRELAQGDPRARSSSARRCGHEQRQDDGSQRSATTKRNRFSSTGTSTTRTSQLGSSRAQIERKSESSRWDPANCSVSRSANEKANPCTKAEPEGESSSGARGRCRGRSRSPCTELIRDQGFEERRKPQRVRPEIVSGGDKRDRVRDRKK